MPRGTLISDHSIASLSGASETLLAADSSRQFLLVYNPSATQYIAVNPTGGTAALNTAGSITIPPLKAWSPDEFVPTNAMTVIGTAGQPVTCVTNP